MTVPLTLSEHDSSTQMHAIHFLFTEHFKEKIFNLYSKVSLHSS